MSRRCQSPPRHKAGNFQLTVRGSYPRPGRRSLKFCLIAEGKGDIYPRFGPTNEWDTAAGQGVLEAAGGEVVTTDGRPLLYGKPGFGNPHFIARSKGAR